jgi:hypothetical protein
MRRFWRWYFAHRACTFFTSRELPVAPQGRLILASRIHPMDSLFLMQALDQPVVVPVDRKIADRFRLVSGINWPPFGRQLTLISYDDLGTDAQYYNIHQLIELGYTVVVYINPENSHPKLNPVLTFESKVMLLARKVSDVWLVDHTSFDHYSVASPSAPAVVRVRLLPLFDLIDHWDEPDSVLIHYIAQWLGYDSARIMHRKS